jgi:hypothetical protein
MAKYSIIKGKTGKAKKVVVAGVKKVLYKKEGSLSKYVLTKGRHMKLTKYKKMKTKTKSKTTKRKRGGSSIMDMFNPNQQGGGKRRRKRKKRKTKK